jgi:Putative Flp pilus-assembly TadE/G-like
MQIECERLRPLALTAARGVRGQALLWFLGLIASLLVAGVGVYSIGQVTSEKQKVVNATDAAAYSGALVQARALNLVAYGNRAEIANVAFLAQTVSLQSWVRYHQKVIENVDTYVVPLLYAFVITSPIAAVIDGILAVMQPIVDALETGVDGMATGVTTAVEVYGNVLTRTSGVLLNGVALSVAAREAADDVLAQNLANQNGKMDDAPESIQGIELGVLNIESWNRAFAQYSRGKTVYNADDGRFTAAEITMASRDDFTVQRIGPSRGNPLSYLIGDNTFGNCWIIEIGSSRDGTTQLRDYERWESQDTSEFVARNRSNWRLRCRPFFRLPTGWGRTTVDEDGNSGDERLNPHNWAGELAYSDEPVNHDGWSGIKELYDLERNASNFGRPTQMDEDHPTKTEFLFHYASAKSRDRVKTADQLGVFRQGIAGSRPLGDTTLRPGMMEDQLAAVSAAKVFFARPKRDTRDFTATQLFRSDAHHEVASLYSPYWQARLTSPSNAALALAYGSRAGLSVFSPSSALGSP